MLTNFHAFERGSWHLGNCLMQMDSWQSTLNVADVVGLVGIGRILFLAKFSPRNTSPREIFRLPGAKISPKQHPYTNNPPTFPTLMFNSSKI